MRGWLLALLLMAAPAAAQEPLRLAAAGSLRAALAEVAAAYPGGPVALTFAPSGLLRQRIAGGEAQDLFASANMEHPQALGATVAFARNRLCAIARPGLEVTPETLLERMLDPQVRLGASTPRADPAGDYAFMLFARAESLRPGARAALEGKALLLTGGPDSARPPEGQDLYAWQFARGAADLFLTYCTNAVLARRADPALRSVPVPQALSVEAEYGMVALTPRGAPLRDFILSAPAQAILARHGFAPP